jgi:hypothetical protein
VRFKNPTSPLIFAGAGNPGFGADRPDHRHNNGDRQKGENFSPNSMRRSQNQRNQIFAQLFEKRQARPFNVTGQRNIPASASVDRRGRWTCLCTRNSENAND